MSRRRLSFRVAPAPEAAPEIMPCRWWFLATVGIVAGAWGLLALVAWTLMRVAGAMGGALP